jgi:hypothetical protein
MHDKWQFFGRFPTLPSAGLCRRAYRESGHRDTLRSKALEADYLVAVRGLLEDSVLLYRNIPVPPQPAIRLASGLAGRQSGPAAPPRDREGGLRALTAREPRSGSMPDLSPLRRRPGGDRQLDKGAQDMAAIELRI